MAQYKTFSSMMGKDEHSPKPPKQENIVEVQRITSEYHRTKLIENHHLVVIDNYTDWCGPCKQCGPKYAEFSKKYYRPGVCVLVKENAEDKLGGLPVSISGVPCFHFYLGGKFLHEEIVSGADMGALEQTIERLLDRIK